MKFDLTIIGAGVIGLAIGNYFQRLYPEWHIIILEKNSQSGQGITSRNSEVIHAGIYYPEHWLKSKLAVSGRKMLYPFLERYGVPHRKTGKFIVAHNESQLTKLQQIYQNAQLKGVEGLHICSGNDIANACPGIKAIGGIFSAETGIVSAGRLVEVLQSQFQIAGGQIAFNTDFVKAIRTSKNYQLTTADHEGDTEVITKRVINSAGLNAIKASESAGIPPTEKLYFCKGHYFKVNGAKNKYKHLVYPVPDETHLGTHLTVGLEGEIKLGPDAVYLPENIEDYGEFLSSAETFRESVKVYWPGIDEFEITPEMTGIRPKLYAYNNTARDFAIREETSAGFPGWVNLFGIESPGLTSALAFGPYIHQQFKNF